MLNPTAANSLHAAELGNQSTDARTVSTPMRGIQAGRYPSAAAAAAPLVKLIVGDGKLNFRKLNLLMGIKGFNMIKFPVAATAGLGFNRDNFCGLKQLLTMPAVALLAAALAFTFFPFAFWLLKGSIG